MTNKKLLKMAIEIVDFPINMVIFYSYVTNYQRVYVILSLPYEHLGYWSQDTVLQCMRWNLKTDALQQFPVWLVVALKIQGWK